jgi:hypothetical protein
LRGDFIFYFRLSRGVLHSILLQKQFFLRETRDGLVAFSGADLSRARLLTRSSKTLDREHRWNNAGFQRRGLSGEKMKGKTSSAKNTELGKNSGR